MSEIRGSLLFEEIIMENEQKTAGKIKKRAEELFEQRGPEISSSDSGNRDRCTEDYFLYLQPAGRDGDSLAALWRTTVREDDGRLYQSRISADGTGYRSNCRDRER